MKVVANGRGRRKRRLPLVLTQGGGLGSNRCRETQDRGRRIRWASQRQGEYVVLTACQQCMSGHVSHALSAGKVSPFDPIVTTQTHSSAALRSVSLEGRPQRPVLKEALLEGGAGPPFEGGKPPAISTPGRGGRNAHGRHLRIGLGAPFAQSGRRHGRPAVAACRAVQVRPPLHHRCHRRLASTSR